MLALNLPGSLIVCPEAFFVTGGLMVVRCFAAVGKLSKAGRGTGSCAMLPASSMTKAYYRAAAALLLA
jgi:hypothetical protein